MSKQEGNKTIMIVCWVDWAPEDKGAFVAEFRDYEGEKLGTRWLPYSRVKMRNEDGVGGFTVRGVERGKEIVIDLPMWLAEKDDIAELIRDQVLSMEAGDEMDDEGEEDRFDDDIPF